MARSPVFGIVVFPGSNCDRDVRHVVESVAGARSRFLWHKDTELGDVDLVVLPGGFSYGDYLRPGAIAHLSPIMAEVRRFAAAGRPVLGICNGFQVLCESGMLPGALLRNASMHFVCQDVTCTVETGRTPFTAGLEGESVLMPVAHGDGNYFLEDEDLDRLEGQGQVVFRYRDNPNGSVNDIAGVCNAAGNVVGLMPHPERSAEQVLGTDAGKRIFEAAIASVA